MKKIMISVVATLAFQAYANDSTGFVATGGIQYLKNTDIQMYSEDLFISKKKIKVDYQFKNLTNKDITETILFPLPKVDNFFESDFADTAQLLKSFKVTVNSHQVQPQTHVRTFIQKDENSKVIDTTELFKQCGFSDSEMLNPWNRKSYEYSDFEDKLRSCKAPQLEKLLQKYKDDVIPWSSQVIYSWKQTFKANAITRVQHEYTPLIGGSVAFSEEYEAKEYCMDSSFKAGLKKANLQNAPYAALGYILKTGANWANQLKISNLPLKEIRMN